MGLFQFTVVILRKRTQKMRWRWFNIIFIGMKKSRFWGEGSLLVAKILRIRHREGCCGFSWPFWSDLWFHIGIIPSCTSYTYILSLQHTVLMSECRAFSRAWLARASLLTATIGFMLVSYLCDICINLWCIPFRCQELRLSGLLEGLPCARDARPEIRDDGLSKEFSFLERHPIAKMSD